MPVNIFVDRHFIFTQHRCVTHLYFCSNMQQMKHSQSIPYLGGFANVCRLELRKTTSCTQPSYIIMFKPILTIIFLGLSQFINAQSIVEKDTRP